MSSKGEITFLRTYKDYICQFNMLERNIGYCLRYSLKRKGNATQEKWLSASFDSKVKRIIALAEELKLQGVFHPWHQEVKTIRVFRNIISHGDCDWQDWLPKPIRFHAPEIKNGECELTIEEFKQKLHQLQNVSNVFSEIRKSLELAIEKNTQEDTGSNI